MHAEGLLWETQAMPDLLRMFCEDGQCIVDACPIARAMDGSLLRAACRACQSRLRQKHPDRPLHLIRELCWPLEIQQLPHGCLHLCVHLAPVSRIRLHIKRDLNTHPDISHAVESQLT